MVNWKRVIGVAGALVFAVGAFAAEAEKPAEDAGWIAPFNGKDLSGWQNAHDPKAENKWSVEDGAMTNVEHGTDIATVDQYKDFELTLEYKTVKDGNSGVYLRGRTELQVLDSFGKKKLGVEDNGAIYSQFAPKVNASKPAGEWNTLEVRLLGPALTAKLNGQVVLDNITLKEVCPGALPGGLEDAGPLRFQGDHGKVWYRNIKLKPITK